MDVFSQYGADQTGRQKPAPLQGVIKTRAAARKIYGEIVAEINACEDRDQLDIYLMTVGEELLQFQGELEFFWHGDGDDFAGLDEEIRRAKARLDADTGGFSGIWS